MEKEYEQTLIDDFVSKFEIGTVFDVMITKVKNSKIIVNINNIHGIIKKEDTNWNELEKLENLVFEGETTKAVYIKHYQDKLYFSLKLLNEKPYDDCLYNLPLTDLLKYAGHTSNVFIGQAKKYFYGVFIENLYSANEHQKGKLLIDPIFGYNLRAIVYNAKCIESNKFYKIELGLERKHKRQKSNQLFQFIAVNIEETNNPYKEDVELTFEKFTSPAGNVATAHLLAEVGKNMYSSKDRMFFELIQNADDAASKKGAVVHVQTSGDYLIVRHNGNSFDKDDFEAITSAANGTKKANENKTGYKGIGFKSVFTDSEKVFIKTGGYQFMFDREDRRFHDFETFYFSVNKLNTIEQQCEFLRKFNSEYKRFKGVDDIPWQLEPIWVDSYPTELGDDFVSSNVSIALKLGENKIDGNNGYCETINDIINNPRFMLFLRNTKRIDFNGKSVFKHTDNDVIILKNSFDTNRIEYFARQDFDVSVSNAAFEESGIDIRIKVEERDDTTKEIIEAQFIDLHNQVLENIPKKIAINTSTVISFAVPTDKDGELKPNTKCNEISMFAFLPTLVKDFKFPFYINANFILDPPRQRILGDNLWNFYLMQQIAYCIVRWCASLNKKQDKNALNILVSEYFKEDSVDTKQLAKWFNSAYKTALESEAFILNHKDELVRQDEIIIDKTRLSSIVGAELFCKLLGTNKCLPSEKIDTKILENDLFDRLNYIKFEDIIDVIINNADFNNWFISTSDEKKQDLYGWINANDTDKRVNLLRKLVLKLPLFSFGEKYKSCEEINSCGYIVTTEHIVPIKNILSKLGFICSENIYYENNPLSKFIEIQNDEDLFNTINSCDFTELKSNEKRDLFLSFSNFEGISKAKLKEVNLFKNINGEFKPLGDMTEYRENTPRWLQPYVICESDYCYELAEYLIAQKDEFKSIIQKHIKDIETSFGELYKFYKSQWTSEFTHYIIDHFKINNDYLKIIEESDTNTKIYFLNKIKRLDLTSTSFYNKDSYEYRILQLVLSIYEEPSVFSEKIFFDGQCIKKFTVSDDVVCKFTQDGEPKKVKMSLAKLLPQYQNQSDIIKKVKNLFENKKDLGKFFTVSEKLLSTIEYELEQVLKIPERNFAKWDVNGNAHQYLFAVYYRREIKNWNNLYVPKIELHNKSTDFITDLMDFIYENDISIAKSPFTYHIKDYFIGKCFNSAYVFKDECLLHSIEEWANNDKKRHYLTNNGVRDSDNYSIKFRREFLENKLIDYIEKLSDDDLNSGITFIATADGYEKPFKKSNQQLLLLSIKDKCKELSIYWDDCKINKNSEEWNTPEYKRWINDHHLHIYIYHGLLPRFLSHENTILLYYDESDENYRYDKQEQRLFVNNRYKIEDILLEVAKKNDTDFDFDDYKKLCLDGKVSVSETEIANKEEMIKSLSEENRKKDKIIEQYRKKYGDLNNESNSEGRNIQDTKTTNSANTYAQDEIKSLSGTVVERDNLSKEKQIEAHKEAEQIIKKVLCENGYDCSSWIINDKVESNEWQSFNQVSNIISPEGDNVNLVIKSAKGGYIYLSSTDFEFLTSNRNNILMVWDGNNVHSATAEDVFKNDSNVNLIFDTEYTPKHYYAALSKVFQYIKRTTFVVKNPSYSAYNKVKSFGLDSKTEGIQELFDDDNAL